MKSAVLFSGGKDSCYATYLMKKEGVDISCLISILSENCESYMFHTPSISKVKVQAEVMNLPLIIRKTLGKKEDELKDLEKAIENAISNFKIEGIITGAVESVYQKSRIQKICSRFNLKCFNPIWKKNQFSLLEELIKNNFNILITGVFAYPLDRSWLGRKIDENFVKDLKHLYEKYKINPAGEGGEFETFVLNCPLFNREIKVTKKTVFGNKNSWWLEIDAE